MSAPSDQRVTVRVPLAEYAPLIDDTRPTLRVPDMDAIVAHPFASLKRALTPPPIPRECRARRRRRDAVTIPLSPLQARKADIVDQLRVAAHFRRECLLVELARVNLEIERNEKRSDAE
jgi:hypothetical protein